MKKIKIGFMALMLSLSIGITTPVVAQTTTDNTTTTTTRADDDGDDDNDNWGLAGLLGLLGLLGLRRKDTDRRVHTTTTTHPNR